MTTSFGTPPEGSGGTDPSTLPPPEVPAPSSQPAPGWYTEPGTDRLRYWAGNAWGEYAPPANSQQGSSGTPDGKGIQVAGYICAGLSALMPLLGLAGLILGILTATKRGRGGHGAAIIVLSIVVAGIGFVLWTTVFLHNAAQSSGSCYYDPSGNYVCP